MYINKWFISVVVKQYKCYITSKFKDKFECSKPLCAPQEQSRTQVDKLQQYHRTYLTTRILHQHNNKVQQQAEVKHNSSSNMEAPAQGRPTNGLPTQQSSGKSSQQLSSVTHLGFLCKKRYRNKREYISYSASITRGFMRFKKVRHWLLQLAFQQINVLTLIIDKLCFSSRPTWLHNNNTVNHHG